MSHSSKLSHSVLVSFFAATILLGACGNDDGGDPATDAQDGDWPAFLTIEELIARSDAIVIATLYDEEIETIEVPPEDGDTADSSVTEILRSFQVEESFAGGLSAGDYFTTFSTASIVHEPHDGSTTTEIAFQVLRLEPGDTVLLFISVVAIPEYYPIEWGTLAWAAPGEPHTARPGEDGALRWETTGRYDAALEARDLEPGDGGAGAAFDTTLDELRALIADLFEPAPEEPEAPPGDEEPAPAD